MEQNHYMDGRFLSTDSVFGKSHLKFNKKDLKLEENEDSVEMEYIWLFIYLIKNKKAAVFWGWGPLAKKGKNSHQNFIY